MQHFIQPFSVGEALLKQNALLLPDVYDSFHEKLQQIMQLRGIACDGCDIRSIETPNCFEANFHPCWNTTWLTNVVSRSMVQSCITMVATLSMLLMCV